MRFDHQLVYPADPGSVFAMLADREFREQVCRAQGASRCDIRIDTKDSRLEVVVEQHRPTQGVPGFAAKLVGEEVRIVTFESWSGPSTADLLVEVPGRPGRLDGGIRLDNAGDRTVQRVSGEITVGIPLIGGRIEQLIGKVLGQALEVEQGVGRDWLAR